MKKFILLSLIISVSFAANAQVFSGWNGPISDDGVETCFQMVVSGLNPAYLDTIFGLERVCVDITHPLATDLDIFLKAPTPDGDPPIYIELSSDNGGTGANYTSTCFTMFSGSPIASGTAPFTGFFVPEQPLGAANTGLQGNDVWELCITDDTMDDAGILNEWTLEFSDMPAPPFGVIQPVCNVYQTIGCHCPDGTDDCDLLPDIMVPAQIMQTQNTEYPGYMTVSTGTSNVGYGPLEFIGSGEWYCGATLVSGPEDICLGGEYPEQLVYQRIYQKSSTGAPSQYYQIEAGTMQHHAAEGHDHLHIDSWVRNSIRLRGPDPDPSTWPIIVEGGKASFCAMDLLQCNEPNELCVLNGTPLDIATMPNGYLGNGYVCDDFVQGVSVGYSDVYGQNLEGQDIQFGDSLCNGAYYLVTVFDPDNIFLESREDNNTTAILVQLSEQNPDCCEARFNVVDQGYGTYLFQDKSVPVSSDWFWDFGDGYSSNLQFPTHTYATSGTYDVTLTSTSTAGAGCTSTIMKVVSMTGVSVEEFTAIEQLGIRPNPFSESAIATFSLATASSLNVSIYNSFGQEVKRIYENEMFSAGSHSFELNKLEAGMYVLKFESDSKSKSYKFIKE